MKMYIHNHKSLIEKRKALRNKMTPAESALWNMLRKSQLEGRKFRRQHSVDGYILDFYCPSEHLAIELDGANHFTTDGLNYDEARTSHLSQYNIKVIRFENKSIFERPDWVLDEIRRNF